ncbi:hypothetical protein [Deinococcus yunweiensis]|uniref:hypothetical protein n=1 Tax=Deinococcus yunweiensis TaxID=367282 RepID=UPI00398F1247
MARTRTVTLTPAATSAAAPAAWIVTVDGTEFTHGHQHALSFDLPEDAWRFAQDLSTEYGDGAVLRVVGLDTTGLPVEPLAPLDPDDVAWLDDVEQYPKALRTPWQHTEWQLARALTLDAPAAHRRDLALALYHPPLPPRHERILRRLEPEFVVARLKAMLPAERVEYAAWYGALLRLRRTGSLGD